MNYGQSIMSSHDWYNNLSSAEKKKIDVIKREEDRIERAQEKLDESWENEITKRKRMGYDDPLGSMFDDNFSNQWNQKAEELNQRRENNTERWDDFI